MNHSWHNKLSFKSKLWQVWNWPSLGSIPLHYCWRMERLETKYKNLIITQQDGLVNQSTCSPTWGPRPSPETTRCRTTTDSSLFFSKFHISTSVCVLLPYQISKWNQENNKSLIECLSLRPFIHTEHQYPQVRKRLQSSEIKKKKTFSKLVSEILVNWFLQG